MHLKDELRPRFLRRQWRVQRAIWGLMALFLLLAAAGLTGGGLLGVTEATSEQGGVAVTLAYHPWTRVDSPQALEVQATAPAGSGSLLSVSLANGLLDQATVRGATPPPDATSVGAHGATYTWQVDDWSGPVAVELEYAPSTWGRLEGDVVVTVGDGPGQRVDVSQTVLP